MSSQCYNVVGVTFEGRQQLLSDFFRSYRHGGKYDVRLKHEKNNQYDKNAVSVNLDFGGADYRKVGYISRQDNGLLVKHLGKVKCAYLRSMGPNHNGDIGLTIEAEFDD